MEQKNMQKEKFEQLLIAMRKCQKQLTRAQSLLTSIAGGSVEALKDKAETKEETDKLDKQDDLSPFRVERYPNGEEVIEGLFNGYEMIGPDGATYSVPENYASKSKLVEGDLLKLTITLQGRFIYKQTGPVDREIKRGILMYSEEKDQYYISCEGLEFNLLKASVTYYKGEPGDEVVALVPRGRTAVWAALDNIVKEIEAPEAKEEIEPEKTENTAELEEI